MGQINKNDILSWTHKSLISICFIIGGMFATYNLTAFKTDKIAFYYHDDSQFWLAFGISFLVIGWVIRNWKKI